MTAKKLNKKGLLLLLFLLPLTLAAQDNCTQKLRNARNLYQEGKLSQLPVLLKPCIISGFSKEEKIEALRLVTLSQLYSEEEEQAEQAYLSLLKVDPEFRPNAEADPTELILLAEKFNTAPKFFWGAKIGAAYNLVQVINPTGNISSNLGPGKYAFTMTIGGGVFFEYPINELMSVNAEAYFMQRNLIMNKLAINSQEQSDGQTISEQHNWLELPLLFNYTLIKKPIVIKGTAGPSFHYLLSSNLSAEGGGASPINNLDNMGWRRQLNMSGVIGLRAHLNTTSTAFITLSVLYQHRLLTEVISNSTYSQEEEDRLFEIYEDGQFKGHAIWLKVGVRIPYYKPELK